MVALRFTVVNIDERVKKKAVGERDEWTETRTGWEKMQSLALDYRSKHFNWCV